MNKIIVDGIKKDEQLTSVCVNIYENKHILTTLITKKIGIPGVLRLFNSDDGMNFKPNDITINRQHGLQLTEHHLIRVKNNFLIYLTTLSNLDPDKTTTYVSFSDNPFTWDNGSKILTIEKVDTGYIYDIKVIYDGFNCMYHMLYSFDTCSGTRIFHCTSINGINFHNVTEISVNICLAGNNIYVSNIVKHNNIYGVYCNVSVDNEFKSMLFVTRDLLNLIYVKQIDQDIKNILTVNVLDDKTYITSSENLIHEAYLLNIEERQLIYPFDN